MAIGYVVLPGWPARLPSEMQSAPALTFQTATANTVGWDQTVAYLSSLSSAAYNNQFTFWGYQGATYDFSASSYFDPTYIAVYDQFGQPLAENMTESDYGNDYLLQWVAPYTGTYYVEAGWSQGSASVNKGVTLIIGADYDTALSPPPTTVNGSPVDDILNGTSGPNVFWAAAGNDWMMGAGGDDTLHGATGIDTALFLNASTQYAWFSDGLGGAIVTDTVAARDGQDTLDNVERLFFTDVKVALDLGGHAGTAAKIINGVYGQAALSNTAMVGTVLGQLDHGMTEAAALQAALDYQLGSNASHAQVVDLLYTNVIGTAPPQQDRDYFTGLLDAGSYTVQQLAIIAIESVYSAQRIDLPGLSTHGLVYSGDTI